MRNIIYSLLTVCYLLVSQSVSAQTTLQSPREFLGYALGERFTPHHKVVAYFEYLGRNVNNMKLQQYGTSYEGRPLLIAVISSQANIDRLEEIRTNNLRLAGFAEGQAAANQPAVVWLSYNVHGNESVSTEASMQTIYELLQPQNSKWLENTVVMIDPCLNPDGRDRYVNWYTQMVGSKPNVSPDAREHHEPWPGGRFNHYLYDLNRDWAWQSQQETRQRVSLYHQWMPQIHADFHEMGVESPYYFAPAAEPYHLEVTPWQRDFQVTIGKNHARYFDQKGWLYFTKETFDLLYPSYGDSWPIFNGAVAMTYEQGGSGRAGLGIETATGDTLTLFDRIAHHHAVGLSTVEATSANSSKVVAEFKNYYDRNRNSPTGSYKTYILKGNNDPGKLNEMLSYLDRQNIRYGYAGEGRTVRGYNYTTGATENVSLDKTDVIISAYQPKSVMLKVLFDPKTTITDSVTYDATAWALPYSYGLTTYAVTERLNPSSNKPAAAQAAQLDEAPYAYVSQWKNFNDLQFLSRLLDKDIKVRFTEKEFEMNNKKYAPGTLIITRADNELLGARFDQAVRQVATELNQPIETAATGFVAKGVDFGSTQVHFLRKPRVALFSGESVSPTAFGEIWHFFEQQLQYPVTVVNAGQFGSLNLDNYDVLIMPNGYYGSTIGSQLGKLRDWVSKGGKVIALDNANNVFANNKDFGLKKVEEEAQEGEKKDNKPVDPNLLLKKYGNREREQLSDAVEGSIFRVHLDNTHPLAFGYGDIYFTLRRTAENFGYFKEGGWNVGVIKDNGFVDGFAGYKVKQKLKNTLVFGVQDMGKGNIVHLVDNPVFRSSWQNGKLLFGNAVFMVGN